jgi:hypothetical protein
MLSSSVSSTPISNSEDCSNSSFSSAGFVFLGLSAIFFLVVSAFSAGAGFGLSASSFFFSSSSESV